MVAFLRAWLLSCLESMVAFLPREHKERAWLLSCLENIRREHGCFLGGLAMHLKDSYFMASGELALDVAGWIEKQGVALPCKAH